MLPKFMRVLLLTSGMLLCASPYAAAQAAPPPSPDALEAARELVSSTSVSMVSAFVASATDQNWPRVEAGLRGKNPKLDADTLAELRREFERLLVSSMVVDMTESAEVYARYFTVQELREMIAFYRTSTGAKTLAVMPSINAEFLRNLSGRLPQLMALANQRFGAILQRRGFAP